MTRVFFSHASEDKALVEAVYHEFVTAYPDHQPWVDKYEIVGGDSLITKIAKGMDAADKFFIFLSPVSVKKPWVEKELHRALMREITGKKPYVVPVKIGNLKTLPPFLEEKLYIDLSQLTKPEWLAQFDAAIKGVVAKPTQGTSNVAVEATQGDTPNKVLLTFSAIAWAEQFAWVVATTMDVRRWDVTNIPMSVNEFKVDHSPRFKALRFDEPELRPGRPVILELEFDEPVTPEDALEGIAPWPRD